MVLTQAKGNNSLKNMKNELFFILFFEKVSSLKRTQDDEYEDERENGRGKLN